MKRKIVALLLAASTLIIGCSPKDMETEMVFVTEINKKNAIAYTLDGEEYSFPKEDTNIGDIYTLILDNGNIVKLKYEGNIASIDNSNAHGNHVLMLSNGSVLPIETTESTEYPLLMQATEIEDNIVTCVDRHGHEWKFESDDAFVGDLYTCIMSDNGTEDITDDEIMSIKFSGEVSEWTTENMINMNEVIDFETTETGLYLHFENGTGYYWER